MQASTPEPTSSPKTSASDEHEKSPETSLLAEDDVIEETLEGGRKVRRRGIYLLPNLLTTSALFSGFYAIVAAMHGEFANAAAAIFVAMVFDGLDGRVARLTNTQSAFGEQYDSLADMVSFGVAPALVAFSWILGDLGKTGWVAAFVYVAGAALRLARFNVQIGAVDKRWFIGLPSPAAAALIAGMVWTLNDFDLNALAFKMLAVLTVAGAGLLMVSGIRYYSFKDLDLKGRVPFVMLLAIVLAFVIVSLSPATVLLLFFFGYALSGPARLVWRWRQNQKKSA